MLPAKSHRKDVQKIFVPLRDPVGLCPDQQMYFFIRNKTELFANIAFPILNEIISFAFSKIIFGA